MEIEKTIEQAKSLLRDCKAVGGYGAMSSMREFLRQHAGAKSQFYIDATAVRLSDYIADVLRAFIDYMEKGLLEGRDPKREAQIEVVGDFLDQSRVLLETKNVHPAAPTVLIGASLEEFLRNWIDTDDVKVSGKPGLANYSSALVKEGLISKQDKKNIDAWAGLRNHAAHGEFDMVTKPAVQAMLLGVNHFIEVKSS